VYSSILCGRTEPSRQLDFTLVCQEARTKADVCLVVQKPLDAQSTPTYSSRRHSANGGMLNLRHASH